MSSSSRDEVAKSPKAQEEQSITRTDSPDMATEVIEVDGAYLTSSTLSKFFRGVLFQMLLL